MGLRYKILRRSNRTNLVVRWFDERSNCWREKTLPVTRRREAEQIAEEVVVREQNRLLAAGATSWDLFRVRYEEEHGPTVSSLSIWKTAAKRFEEICSPSDITTISKSTFSIFESGLRKRGLQEESVRTYMKYIRAALNWASDLELIPKAPKVKLPRRTRGKLMKGRPITGEEFDRMMEAAKAHPTFKPLLEGLWLSGLRLGESLNLWWDRDDRICIENIDGKRPVMRIPAHMQKSRRETINPLTPDFVGFLRKLDHRTGPVFDPRGKLGRSIRTTDYVSRLICSLGKSAKIVANRDPITDRVKWASAHDLRRSFGRRWSQKVMPAVLKDLMRHERIETTLLYYVGEDAEQISDLLWNLPRGEDNLGCQSHPRKPRRTTRQSNK